MVALTRVEYRIDSPYGSVRACLQKKREVARSQAEGGIHGIGPESCCSFVTYVDSQNRADNVFGNSRIRIPNRVINGINITTACVHGELTALWNAIEDVNNIPTILEIYIEMSPCENCGRALNNVLRQNQEVLYSFLHPNEREDWRQAARALCAG